MLKVLKFGGSSLADAEQFRKVAAIIEAETERRYVVASAPGKRFYEDEKVTDLLLHCHALANDRNPFDDTFRRISERFKGIIKDLGLTLDLEDDLDEAKACFEKCVEANEYHMEGHMALKNPLFEDDDEY